MLASRAETGETGSSHRPGSKTRVLRQRFRLGGVIAFTTVVLLIPWMGVAAGVFLVSLLLFIRAGGIRNRLALTALATTFLFYLLGNVLFSPSESTPQFTYGWFRINYEGCRFGLLAALRRSAGVALSLAWVLTTPLPRVYDALSFLPGRRWVMLFLRNLQLLRADFITARRSIALRSPARRTIRQRVLHLRLAMQATLLRVFVAVPTLAYSSETIWIREEDSPSSAASVELRDVSVRYASDAELAIDHVSCVVPAGDLIVLRGSSEAGKTTLLRTIAGVIPQLIGEVAGEIRIDGESTTGVRLRRMASLVRFVPSEAGKSLVGLTVAHEIRLRANDDDAAHWFLRRMGIDHLWDQETVTLSGGEQVRLLFAGILAATPRVVLFDAPLEQLDWVGRRTFLNALGELHATRAATIVVAADDKDIRAFADGVWQIENGRLSVDGRRDSASASTSPKRSIAARSVGKPVAELSGIAVTFGNRMILEGVSLSIASGERVVVLGLNGSGKTTALLALAGIQPIDAGTIRREGRVGYVFQDFQAQHVEVDVEDEVALESRLRGWPDGVPSGAIAWSEAEPQTWTIDLHPQPGRFVSIVAMEQQKALLALDEPTIGLDRAGTAKLLHHLSELSDAGTGIAVITHETEVAAWADRAVVIHAGRARDFDNVPEAIAFVKRQQMGGEFAS